MPCGLFYHTALASWELRRRISSVRVHLLVQLLVHLQVRQHPRLLLWLCLFVWHACDRSSVVETYRYRQVRGVDQAWDSVLGSAEILIKLNFTLRHVSDSGIFLYVSHNTHSHLQQTSESASTSDIGSSLQNFTTIFTLFPVLQLVIQLNFCLVCVLIAWKMVFKSLFTSTVFSPEALAFPSTLRFD